MRFTRLADGRLADRERHVLCGCAKCRERCLARLATCGTPVVEGLPALAVAQVEAERLIEEEYWARVGNMIIGGKTCA